jgi:hypothetical protein
VQSFQRNLFAIAAATASLRCAKGMRCLSKSSTEWCRQVLNLFYVVTSGVEVKCQIQRIYKISKGTGFLLLLFKKGAFRNSIVVGVAAAGVAGTHTQQG